MELVVRDSLRQMTRLMVIVTGEICAIKVNYAMSGQVLAVFLSPSPSFLGP